MKNYIQPGSILSAVAPTGGVLSGQGMLAGSIFGVAQFSAAQGEPVEIAVEGVFELTKVGSQAWTVGLQIYWDDTNKRCTSAYDAAHTLIGVAVAAVADGANDTKGRVRLNGAFGVMSKAYIDAGDA
jgi:predicted RecA/RadA family phage recombinase